MLWVVPPCCHTLKSIARQCVAQGLQHVPKQGLQQGLRQNLARGGETEQVAPFQRKLVWPQKRAREDLSEETFLTEKTPPTPKRKTSEKVPVRKQYASGPGVIFTPEKVNL